jgi:hypothetical protein
LVPAERDSDGGDVDLFWVPLGRFRPGSRTARADRWTPRWWSSRPPVPRLPDRYSHAELGARTETAFAAPVAGCLLLGISGGYHFGVETVWHWSNATFIEGAVGDLTPDDWEAGLAFDWGVFTYKTMLPGNGRPLVVVNYWVE